MFVRQILRHKLSQVEDRVTWPTLKVHQKWNMHILWF